MPSPNSLSNEWLDRLYHIKTQGAVAKPRGIETREVIGHQLRFNMQHPVLLIADRELGYKFLCAEAAWILSGDNKVSSIHRYSKAISKFSDDGVFFKGAYGPKVVDQLTYVVDCLEKDTDSRQAVMSIWRENPRNSFDTPCTLNLQFLIRENKLHTIVNMRSSDIWLGVPYDAFNFTMISCAVLLLLRRRTGSQVALGTQYFNAGSQHLYETNFEQAEKVIRGDAHYVIGDVKVDPYEFDDHEHLTRYLWRAADGTVPDGFLADLSYYSHAKA